MLTLRGLEGLPEVQSGDDLARLLLDGMLHSGAEPADGDIVVVWTGGDDTEVRQAAIAGADVYEG